MGTNKLVNQAKSQARQNQLVAKEHPELVPTKETPENYITTASINTLTSVKKDTVMFEPLVAKTLASLMLNGTDAIKLQAIREYKDMIKTQKLFVKNGDTKIAMETGENQIISFDLSNHQKSDKPAEDFSQVKNIDLIKGFRDDAEEKLITGEDDV
jgi:hypothetical protein